MVFNRSAFSKQHKSSGEPVSLSEVIEGLFDPTRREIHTDPKAELERKLSVVERLVDATHQVREEEISRANAGEERNPEDMKLLGEQLIELIAKQEQLRQELHQEPPEQP